MSRSRWVSSHSCVGAIQYATSGTACTNWSAQVRDEGPSASQTVCEKGLRGHKVRRIVGDAAAAAETLSRRSKRPFLSSPGEPSPQRGSIGPDPLRKLLGAQTDPCHVSTRGCTVHALLNLLVQLRPTGQVPPAMPVARTHREEASNLGFAAQWRRRGRCSRTKRRAGQARPVADDEESGGGCTACRQVADVGRRPSYEPRRKQLCAQPCCTSGRRLAQQYWGF